MKLIGIAVVLGTLAIIGLSAFGIISFHGDAQITQDGQQLIDNGASTAKGAASNALDALKRQVK